MSEYTGQSVRVPMADGTQLSGRLLLPTDGDRFPTLVRKTPYAFDRGRDLDLALLDHGYAVLVVHMRGRFESEGTFSQMLNEGIDHNDGADTIDWAGRQPWSTGAVGTFGTSSDGQWQLAAATRRPRHLRAMLVSYAADAVASQTQRGVPLGTLPAWTSLAGLARRLASVQDWQAWLASLAGSSLSYVDSLIVPEILAGLRVAGDLSFWNRLTIADRYDQIQVPVLHECGWFDRYVTTTVRNFRTIRATSKSTEARTGQRLLLGPWTHGGGLPKFSEEGLTIGTAGAAARVELHVKWFDRWLRDGEPFPDWGAEVRYFVLGMDEWRVADDWPPAGASLRDYYLTPSEEASSDHRLTRDVQAPDRWSLTLDHDPRDPIISIGGHGGVGWQWPAGPLDQRPAEARSLVFSTEPLEDDVVIVGDATLILHASTAALDADFIVALTDVAESGYSSLVRQTAVRLSHRGPASDELPVPARADVHPGEVYRLDVSLDGLACRFAAGHRIRLRVSPSSFPAYLPNPGTTGGLDDLARATATVQAIHGDAADPPRLTLPCMPS